MPGGELESAGDSMDFDQIEEFRHDNSVYVFCCEPQSRKSTILTADSKSAGVIW